MIWHYTIRPWTTWFWKYSLLNFFFFLPAYIMFAHNYFGTHSAPSSYTLRKQKIYASTCYEISRGVSDIGLKMSIHNTLYQQICMLYITVTCV